MASTGYLNTTGAKTFDEPGLRSRYSVPTPGKPHQRNVIATKSIGKPQFPHIKERKTGFRRILRLFKSLLITIGIALMAFYLLGLLILGIQNHRLSQSERFPQPDFEGLVELQLKIGNIRHGNYIGIFRDIELAMTIDAGLIGEIAVATETSGLTFSGELAKELWIFKNQTWLIKRDLGAMTSIMERTTDTMIHENNVTIRDLQRIVERESVERSQNFLQRIFSTTLVPFDWPPMQRKAAVKNVFLNQISYSEEVANARIEICESLVANLKKLEELSRKIYTLKAI